MRIGLMAGNFKNAGDFLITQRSHELMQMVYPDAEIIEIPRWISLEDRLDEINQLDALVFAGGPCYIPNIYPNKIPLVKDLDLIKAKLFVLGNGWWGGDTRNLLIYNYHFTSDTMKFLQRVERDTKTLSCRDFYTVQILRNHGFQNVDMTGCPAWYDIKHVNETSIRADLNKDFKTICISDPAYITNFNQAKRVTLFIKEKFPKAKIKFIFHRGFEVDEANAKAWNIKDTALYDMISEIGVEIVNIENTSEGLCVYDDCDLHIGYRVHGHIYNLSQRNVSILIEEDGRGAGVNQALGLTSISAYDFDDKLPLDIILRTKKNECNFDIENKYIEKNIDDYLYNLTRQNFMILENAFHTMKSYYPIMLNKIKSLEKFI
ncbi:MAG: polysaccharide pyruvyl transferase family protein [Herbinix sp.]|nr:polysaccharide pyruvyl transferase family protein [Herbinix sp.]